MADEQQEAESERRKASGTGRFSDIVGVEAAERYFEATERARQSAYTDARRVYGFAPSRQRTASTTRRGW
jgi:hypothetical protein